MGSRPAGPTATTDPGDIGRLHHVGHVVRDMPAAMALYRRMGFVLPPPTFPALAPAEGEPPRAFGAGNTHVSFRRNFVELVTVVDGQAPSPIGGDATWVPLEAPAEVLTRLTESIAVTAERLSVALARFEGLHILVFQTPDVDAAAARLAAEGVMHRYLRRPVHGDGRARVFDLDDSHLTLVPHSALESVLPGERAPVLPAFVA